MANHRSLFWEPHRKAFYRSLRLLLQSGISLRDSFQVLCDEPVASPKFHGILVDLCSQIHNGIPLSQAISHYRNLFPPLEIKTIQAAEEAGRIEESLKEIESMLEETGKIRRRLLQALAYPFFLIHLSFLAFSLFDSLARGFSTTFFLFRLCLYLLAFYVPLLLLFALHSSLSGRPGYEEWKLKVPFLGSLARDWVLFRFCRNFTSLYSSGISIMRTIELSSATCGNISIEREIQKILAGLKDGIPLEEALRNAPFFSIPERKILLAGEIGGDLEEAFQRVGDYLKERIQQRGERLVKVLPTAVYLIVAAYIAFKIIRAFLGIYSSIPW